MRSEDLEKVLIKAVKNYFNGMSAKEAISESISKGSDFADEKYEEK